MEMLNVQGSHGDCLIVVGLFIVAIFLVSLVGVPSKKSSVTWRLVEWKFPTFCLDLNQIQICVNSRATWQEVINTYSGYEASKLGLDLSIPLGARRASDLDDGIPCFSYYKGTGQRLHEWLAEQGLKLPLE